MATQSTFDRLALAASLSEHLAGESSRRTTPATTPRAASGTA